jgi:plastocyanin
VVPDDAREGTDLRGVAGGSTFSATQDNWIMKKHQTARIGLWSVLILTAAVGKVSAATTNRVEVRGQLGQAFTFNPSNIVVGLGDSIRWTNVSSTSHDVTHATKVGSTWVSNTPPYWAGILFSNTVRQGLVTFSNLGVYPYICVQHVLISPQPNAANPTQTGLVTVVRLNLSPTVAITSPTNLSRLDSPASFTITADAADPDLDGGVTNVLFFSGTNLLGADSVPPYSVEVSNLAGGWYQFTARAVDNLGGATTSGVVNVLVTSNRTVNVEGFSFSPNLLTVTVGDTVTFNGLASFHTVTGTGTLEPFCGSVSPGASCAVTFNMVGRFPFHCIPHQAFGMTGSVEVVGPNLVPFVRITAPASGFTVVTGASFTVSADATDLYGRVATVRFERLPSTILGLDTESPYTVNATIGPAGSYQIQARATDNTGFVTISAPINVNVVVPVAIQLLSPAAAAGGFQFDYTANPGLTYVIEGSAADGSPTPFVSLATNVAGTNRVTFTDTESGARSNRAYRVFRRP